MPAVARHARRRAEARSFACSAHDEAGSRQQGGAGHPDTSPSQQTQTRESRGSHHSHRAFPQFRHHGPHRCRQDDHHRNASVLHGRQPQDRRSARKCRDDGLDGAGAVSAGSPSRPRRPLRSGAGWTSPCRSIASTSSIRPDTSISRSRSKRSLRVLDGAVFRAVCRRRRAAAVRDRVAPGQQVLRAAACLRQQDGSHRRDFFKVVEQLKSRLGAYPVPMQVPIGCRRGFRGRRRPDQDESDSLGCCRQGTNFEYRDIPANLVEKCAEARMFMVEAAAEATEVLMGQVPQ